MFLVFLAQRSCIFEFNFPGLGLLVLASERVLVLGFGG